MSSRSTCGHRARARARAEAFLDRLLHLEAETQTKQLVPQSYNRLKLNFRVFIFLPDKVLSKVKKLQLDIPEARLMIQASISSYFVTEIS